VRVIEVVIRQALEIKGNSPISEVKQGIFQVRGAEPEPYLNCTIFV